MLRRLVLAARNTAAGMVVLLALSLWARAAAAVVHLARIALGVALVVGGAQPLTAAAVAAAVSAGLDLRQLRSSAAMVV